SLIPTGQTRAIALAVQDADNPRFMQYFKGASHVALKNEYTLLLIDLQENMANERSMLAPISRRVDGFIISSRTPDESCGWLLELGKPIVLMARKTQHPLTTVRTNVYRGGYLLGEHLLKTGRRRVAFLGLPSDITNYEGLAAALAEGGLAPSRFTANAPTLEAGEQAASAMLLGGSRPEAVVCRNDLLAMGLMHGAQSLGLRIPDDVAVAGFDNISVARFMYPSLTTVDLRGREQGEIAMQKLLQAILQQGSTEDIVLEPQLMVRSSTANRMQADIEKLPQKTLGN
ncbi:MAG TPA: substrate-binding domain-containing protein, partial [Rhodocyclaceae bacterium]|nr:substrate-binding domain-containing protein [Rhodocyclaceae bacterium]